MTLIFKATQMFLKCFYDNAVKIFDHDDPNIVVILAAVHEFFFAKCAQFPSTFTEWNKTKGIFPSKMLSRN